MYENHYTIQEVVERTGLTDRTLYNWRKSGHLKADIKMGKKWLYSKEKIDKLPTLAKH